jgi:hypothetical protein
MVLARGEKRLDDLPGNRLDGGFGVVKVLTGFDKGVSFPLLSASYSKRIPVLAVRGERAADAS